MNQSGFVLPYSHGIVIGLEAILIKSRAKNDSWWRSSYLIDLDRDRRGSRRRSNGHSINSNQILMGVWIMSFFANIVFSCVFALDYTIAKEVAIVG